MQDNSVTWKRPSPGPALLLDQRLAVVMHLEDSGNRPGRMAGHEIDGNRSATERNLHAVGGDNVTLRLAVRKTVDGLVHHIPIARSHDNMGTIAFLHKFCAADFGFMGMGNNDVLLFAHSDSLCNKHAEVFPVILHVFCAQIMFNAQLWFPSHAEHSQVIGQRDCAIVQ